MLNKLIRPFVTKKTIPVAVAPIVPPVTSAPMAPVPVVEQSEQVAFDLTVGLPEEPPYVEVPFTEEELALDETVFEENRNEEEKNMTKTLAIEVKERMVAAGIDPSDTAAVTAYMLANAEEIKALAAVYENKPETKAFTRIASFNPEVHADFEQFLKEVNLYNDYNIHAALKMFGRTGVRRDFIFAVWKHFDNDVKAAGQYFRLAVGVDAKKEFAKTTAFVTADATRSTGNLVEAGLTKIAQALNKYVFQTAAVVIEAPVGGRPDELKEYNYVNEAATIAWDKVKAKKKEKKETVVPAN